MALCLLLARSIVCSAADSAPSISTAVDEVSRQELLNRANAGVLNARLKLEEWKLARLHLLRERGCATWLEVAKQQLLVDTMSKQRDALQEFAGFTRALEQRAILAAETLEQDTCVRPGRTGSPLKLSLPGSVRLVGWIDRQGLSPGTAGQEKKAASAPPSDAELKAAAENMARAEKRRAGLTAGRSVPEHWKQNAELQLALTRAEWQLARVKYDLLVDSPRYLAAGDGETGDRSIDDQLVHVQASVAAGQTTTLAEFVEVTCGEVKTFVTAGSHPALRELTLQVAEAESHATGALQAAEIELQRCELRLHALQELQSKGFADRVETELDAARKHLAAAVLRVEQFRRQQVNLIQAYQSIQAPRDATIPVVLARHPNSLPAAAGRDAIDGPAWEAWPLPLLTDVQIIRHLMELRRESCETNARREALLLEWAMLESYSAKLESIAEKRDADSGQPQQAIGQADLKSSLLEGLRAEIQALRLDMRHVSASQQAAEERLHILALEERRFVQQCLAQRKTSDQSDDASTTVQFVGLHLPDSLMPHKVAFGGPRHDQPTSFDYLESRDWESRESALEIVVWCATSQGSADYPSGIGLPRPSTPRRINRGTAYPSRRSSLMPEPLSTYPVDNEFRSTRFHPPEQRDRLGSSYGRDYPFGILRSDLRSQQPVGAVPWYLPGSPTNYPYNGVRGR